MSTRSSAKGRGAVIEQLSQRLSRQVATRTVLLHAAVGTHLGLGPNDLKCLDLLRETDTPLTASQLVHVTGLTGGAITGVADRLEAAGYVERVRDPDDRRKWELRVVPERVSSLDTVFAPLASDIASLCARFDDAELDVVHRFLEGTTVALDAQLERLRHRDPQQSTVRS